LRQNSDSSDGLGAFGIGADGSGSESCGARTPALRWRAASNLKAPSGLPARDTADYQSALCSAPAPPLQTVTVSQRLESLILFGVSGCQRPRHKGVTGRHRPSQPLRNFGGARSNQNICRKKQPGFTWIQLDCWGFHLDFSWIEPGFHLDFTWPHFSRCRAEEVG
jgi:hypothetical protein